MKTMITLKTEKNSETGRPDRSSAIIFRYELRQLRRRTIVWSVSLGAIIILMLPVYIQMITGTAGVDSALLKNADMFEMYGISLDIIRTPIGTYAFLTSFILYAVAVYGVNLGITMFTKEYRRGSCDFLYTKPVSRNALYVQKFLACGLSGFSISLIYTAASLPAMHMGASAESFSTGILLRIAASTFFIFISFLCAGFLIGAAAPKVKASLLAAFGIMFFAYVFTTFSAKTGVSAIGWLSPYTYFRGADIIQNGGYQLRNVLVFIVLSGLVLLLGWYVFRRKDIPTFS